MVMVVSWVYVLHNEVERFDVLNQALSTCNLHVQV